MKQELGTLLTGLCLLSLAACGQTPAGGEADQPVAASTPNPRATVSPDEDFDALKPTVLGAAAVGHGWKKRGEVSDGTPSHRKESAQAPVEYCPGHVSEVFKVDRYAAAVSQGFTRPVSMVAGNTRTNTDASLYVSASTLPVPDATELRAAYDADVAACRDYRVGDDLFVVMAPGGVTSVPSADEVVSSFAVRRYSDKAHQKLVGVGQYAVARSGRVVASVVINTLPGQENAGGEDFTEVGTILDQQIQASKAAVPA
jgi:hypothetical protein